MNEIVFDQAALRADVAAAEGACRLVAGAACHETIADPYPPGAEAEKQAFRRAFRWQFFREVSRVTPDERAGSDDRCQMADARHPKPGRGRSRCGPRREFTAAETGLMVAAAKLIPHAEIGAAFGVSAQAINNRLHRFRCQRRDAR